MKLTDNMVRLVLGVVGIVAITVLFALDSLPSFAQGALAVIATVALVSWILGLRQPSPDELAVMVQDALVEGLDAYSDVVLVQDEEDE